MNVVQTMEDVNSTVIIQLVVITVDVTLVIVWTLIVTAVMVHVYMYYYLLFICILDIDECSLNNDGCNQYCTNTDGSYLCYCTSGYHLMNDQRTCAG